MVFFIVGYIQLFTGKNSLLYFALDFDHYIKCRNCSVSTPTIVHCKENKWERKTMFPSTNVLDNYEKKLLI